MLHSVLRSGWWVNGWNGLVSSVRVTLACRLQAKERTRWDEGKNRSVAHEAARRRSDEECSTFVLLCRLAWLVALEEDLSVQASVFHRLCLVGNGGRKIELPNPIAVCIRIRICLVCVRCHWSGHAAVTGYQVNAGRWKWWCCCTSIAGWCYAGHLWWQGWMDMDGWVWGVSVLFYFSILEIRTC